MRIVSRLGAMLGAGLLLFAITGVVSATGTSVTLCHATPPDTAAGGWIQITTDTSSDGSLKGGHDTSHADDIIPAYHDVSSGFDYPGKNLATLFDGVTGQSILDAGCVSVRSSAPPSTPPSNPPSPVVTGQPATDAIGSTRSSRPTQTAGLLGVGLGVLPSSIGRPTPARAESKRLP